MFKVAHMKLENYFRNLSNNAIILYGMSKLILRESSTGYKIRDRFFIVNK